MQREENGWSDVISSTKKRKKREGKAHDFNFDASNLYLLYVRSETTRTFSLWPHIHFTTTWCTTLHIFRVFLPSSLCAILRFFLYQRILSLSFLAIPMKQNSKCSYIAQPTKVLFLHSVWLPFIFAHLFFPFGWFVILQYFSLSV